jgi:hypothetical protein
MSPAGFVTGGNERKFTTVCPLRKLNLIFPKGIQMGYPQKALDLGDWKHIFTS